MPTARTMKIYKSPPIHRTPLYRVKAAYSGMLRRCENRCGTEPAYAHVLLKMTLGEWMRWALPRYKRFTKKFPLESPSVSRKGDKGHYEIGNLEIISGRDNRARQVAILLVRPDGTKLCGRCRQVKTAEGNFSRHRNRPDGLATWCKECFRTR